MNIISRAEAKQQGLKQYFTGKPCKHGHIAKRRTSNGECTQCMRDYNNRRYAENPEKMKSFSKEYRDNNKDLVNEKYRNWREENPDKYQKAQKEYKKNNQSKIKQREKNYRAKNKDHYRKLNQEWSKNNRDRINSNRRKRLKNDLNVKLTKQCRDMLTRVINHAKIVKHSGTFEMLGYTVNNLRQRIESLFIDGMSWSNHGEWHIDHIIPISAWVKVGVTDPKVINALDNLQPLWANDNLTKSDRII